MLVRDWMSSPAVTLPSDTRVVDALELMAVRGIRRVPVLEDGKLVGIITPQDILRYLVERVLPLPPASA